MFHKKLNALISIFLCLTMVLCLFVPTSAADAVSVTRGQASDIIFEAVKAYNAGVTQGDIVKGYPDGQLHEDRLLTKIEAVVMLSRGFGTIPEPLGDNLRLGNFGEQYTDIPAWAANDVKKLQDAGVLSGNTGTTLGVNEFITETELRQMISRIWRLYGNNPKDDFYQYVNKEWLDTAIIPSGSFNISATGEMKIAVNQNLEDMLNELASGKYEKGTKEQIVADFYKNLRDAEAANEAGIKPLEEVLRKIDSAKTLNDVIEADLYIKEKTGESIFFFFDTFEDLNDSAHKVMTFSVHEFPLDKSDYLSNNADTINAYKKLLAALLILAGENEVDANEKANDVIAMEKDVATTLLTARDMQNVAVSVIMTDIDKLDNMFLSVDMREYAKRYGVQITEGTTMYIYGANPGEKYSSYFIEDNTELLKAILKSRLLYEFKEALSDDFREAASSYDKEALGIDEPKSRSQWAVEKTKEKVGDYLEQLYVERFASKKVKADVTEMIKDFISVYKERINELDWLSDETKAAAVKKLEMMDIKVGYPDKWKDFLNGYEIRSYSDGGSAFESICTAAKAEKELFLKSQNDPVDKTEWTMRAYEINACYIPTSNSLLYPSAFLTAPYYDENATRSENLGAIGGVIAHEISHAFDTNGSMFDEYGNYSDWWTEEDYKRFEEKCAAMSELYDNIEIGQGILSDGKQTLTENIADLGGLSCALQVAKEDQNFDAMKFFESWARAWRYTSTRNGYESRFSSDVHSAPRIRVNRLLQNIDEFYEAYGITETDGMFLPKEQRINIW